ncbi:MAG: alpha/beta hydrolase [Deltaproteobacteria bacterium]|nr:alpha/beta hydrolase [Deltaproteobacteria bacterium]
MFEGFERLTIKTSETTINLVKGGSGAPLLLLHGYPQMHAMWHKIAPRLAQDFSVVVPDLRGYGDSGKPADGENHTGYSKRATARDQVEVMEQLGFTKFAVVGHDRGGRVAHRLTLGMVERVNKLAVLDIIPTHAVFQNVNKTLATAYYHWFFLIQPAPLPETLIGNNAEFYLNTMLGRLKPHAITSEAFAEYLRCFSDRATIHGTCEDYRAAATIDLEHDEADLNRKITCPVLALWGEKGFLHKRHDVPAIWRERALDVRGKSLPCGHFLPEEAPEETLAELRAFLKA